MPPGFDVFLSHNSKDKPAVRELAEALRDRSLKVWLDEWELIPGRPWQDALEEIIQTVPCAAVLVGKDGLGPWEIPEMRACLSEFVNRKLPVIPVLLPGTPQKPELPLFLKQFIWVDLCGGLTEAGLDQLQWGITGKKRRRPKPKRSIPEPIADPELSLERMTAIRRALDGKRPAAAWVAAASAVPGQPFTEPLTGIRFLWIPGGRFQMGGNASPEEKPIHWVNISPFWLAETPVTNRQYAVFLGREPGAREPTSWRDQRFFSLNQPVVGVSWEDAQAFCQWLSGQSSLKVVLPSEAQWEFAARGTDGREYPWGNESPDETRACFEAKQQAPVGSYPAGQGPFGTLDQAGNVWEWCRDAWNKEAYAKRIERGGEPVDPVEGESLTGEKVWWVIRGGGWGTPAEFQRAAFRGRTSVTTGALNVGFRVAAAPASLDA